MKTVTERRFYVYAYVRADGTPYYIGKGTGNRAWRHRKADRVPSPKDHGRIRILLDDLLACEALEAEKDFISLIGREKDGGCLINWTAGGDGLVDPSDETLEKLRSWERTSEVKKAIRDGKTRHHKGDAERCGVDFEFYTGLSKKQRYLLKMFVARYPEVSFADAYAMGGRGRSCYAASRSDALAARTASRAASGVIEKIAEKTRDRAPKFAWTHPDHGQVTCAAWELVAMFPEQRLTRPNLTKVANGQRRRAKGWELAA